MLEKAPPEVRRTVRPSGFHPRFFPPRFLFLQVNKRCNLRCVHCAFWRDNDDDKPNYLDREAKRRIMREFAAINPKGAVVICGGESMLDLEDYFDICGAMPRAWADLRFGRQRNPDQNARDGATDDP